MSTLISKWEQMFAYIPCDTGCLVESWYLSKVTLLTLSQIRYYTLCAKKKRNTKFLYTSMHSESVQCVLRKKFISQYCNSIVLNKA